jgi:hypothetical protein
MTVAELRSRHFQVFGEPTNAGHREYLVKRTIRDRQTVPMGRFIPRPQTLIKGIDLPDHLSVPDNG